MFAPSLTRVATSPPPIPPAPIPARLIRSLGGMNPAPPSTWRGTMVVRAVPAAAARNFLRELCGLTGTFSDRFVMADPGFVWSSHPCSNGILPALDAEFNEFPQVITTELPQEGPTLSDSHLPGSQ